MARTVPHPASMRRVLVVDDDRGIRNLVTEVMRDEGFQVDQARNGSEALDRVRSAPPDVIILDLMMPLMDGPSFARACRQDPCCADVPIVMLSSAKNAREVASHLRPFGVRECLNKPFDIDALVGAVEKVTETAAS